MESNINLRVFKIIVLMLIASTISRDQAPQDLQPTAPSALPPSSAQESLEGSPLGFLQRFDQRQNGTENYRIKVDGLVFILAPADSLLLAGAASLDPTFSSALGDKFKPTPASSELDKPKPTKESIHKFASHQEAMRKSGVRINDLMPAFWNRLRQAQQANE
ncbi:hypothetical protein QAD02_017006 [Eretmocerus hayati]|uniref:Uncharacterized protein n=1 Tax=Eretmocerus hayati TaxID=131215 RepID=A0ACC2PC70_9HYME|nr:hypothetical protein QAD02_017006 [Eretmocerus hayati]